MTNSVIIFLPDGKHLGIVVGKGGVNKIFTDKENPNQVVVLTEDGITTYTGFPFQCEKDYAEKKA